MRWARLTQGAAAAREPAGVVAWRASICCCGCIGRRNHPGVIGGAACCGGGAVGGMLPPAYADGIEGCAPMLPAATCAATEYADDMDSGIDG